MGFSPYVLIVLFIMRYAQRHQEQRSLDWINRGGRECFAYRAVRGFDSSQARIEIQ
jgi:hypothetical protein